MSELELEAIKRQVEVESQDELFREQDVAVDADTVEIDVWTVQEEIHDTEDSSSDPEVDLSEEHQMIVEQLKKIMLEGRTGNGIMFKKVDKKVLKVQADRVDEAITYLKRDRNKQKQTIQLGQLVSGWQNG